MRWKWRPLELEVGIAPSTVTPWCCSPLQLTFQPKMPAQPLFLSKAVWNLLRGTQETDSQRSMKNFKRTGTEVGNVGNHSCPKFTGELSVLSKARSKDQGYGEKACVTKNNGETWSCNQGNCRQWSVLEKMERDGSNVNRVDYHGWLEMGQSKILISVSCSSGSINRHTIYRERSGYLKKTRDIFNGSTL